MDPSSTTHA